MASNGENVGSGLGLSVSSNHTYGEGSDFGFVNYALERMDAIDPNKALLVASTVAGLGISRSRLPLPVRAVGVIASGLVGMSAISEIGHARVARRERRLSMIRDMNRAVDR